VFVRDCFVHLEDDSIIRAIHNVINSGSKYFATTTFPKCSNNGKTLNKDRWRELNMMLSPFFFPEPLELLPDMVDEALDNKYVGVWKVSDLNKISVS
jgi:hypothetical protein